MSVLALLALLALGSSIEARAGEDWGPWDGRWAPVEGVEAAPAPRSARHGALEAMYQFYRHNVSGTDGPRCPFYPTCSAYFITSVRAHGPMLGAVYTIDRLLREYPYMNRADHYPLVTPHEMPRLLDPIPPRHDHHRERER